MFEIIFIEENNSSFSVNVIGEWNEVFKTAESYVLNWQTKIIEVKIKPREYGK